MNTLLFFPYGKRMLIFFFFLFSKRVQILKTEYKYGQYCTPLTQSDCRYFFVLAITYHKKRNAEFCEYPIPQLLPAMRLLKKLYKICTDDYGKNEYLAVKYI